MPGTQELPTVDDAAPEPIEEGLPEPVWEAEAPADDVVVAKEQPAAEQSAMATLHEILE